MMKKTKEIRLCYVCSKPVSGGDYVCVSSEIFRHKKCAIGTSNWMKSQVADQSDFYGLFKDQIKETRNKKPESKTKKTKKKTPMDVWIENNKKLREGKDAKIPSTRKRRT